MHDGVLFVLNVVINEPLNGPRSEITVKYGERQQTLYYTHDEDQTNI